MKKELLCLSIASLMVSGCATLQRQHEPALTEMEIIDIKMKQTLGIAETSLEVSRKAEELAVEALDTSRQAEATSQKALEAANKAVDAANEARRFAEEEVKKALEAVQEARKYTEQEVQRAIDASNRASKTAMDHADRSAQRAVDAANEAVKAANEASEKAISVANQTIAEVNRLRATIEMQPDEDPIVMPEPRVDKTYIIRPGDTLSEISYKHYGTSCRWREIYEKNRAVIKNPDVLTPGTRINLP